MHSDLSRSIRTVCGTEVCEAVADDASRFLNRFSKWTCWVYVSRRLKYCKVEDYGKQRKQAERESGCGKQSICSPNFNSIHRCSRDPNSFRCLLAFFVALSRSL